MRKGEKTMTFAKSAKSNGNGLDLNGSGSHAWLAVSGSHLALMLLAHWTPKIWTQIDSPTGHCPHTFTSGFFCFDELNGCLPGLQIVYRLDNVDTVFRALSPQLYTVRLDALEISSAMTSVQ